MTAATTNSEQDEIQTPVRCRAPGCAKIFARNAAFCPYCGREQSGKPKSAIGAASDAGATPALRPPRDDAFSQGAAGKDRGPAEPAPPPVDDNAKIADKLGPKEELLDVAAIPSSNSTRKPLRARPFVIALSGAVILLVGFVVWPSMRDHGTGVPDGHVIKPEAERAPAPKDSTDSAAVKPSFPCPGDGFADEKTICANAGLASLEIRMQRAYQALVQRQPAGRIPIEVGAYKQAALSKRHACDTDAACIMNILMAEEQYFSEYGN
jgi:hypothetical protein